MPKSNMEDRVLLAHYSSGVRGIIRLDMDAREMKDKSVYKLGLPGIINALFDNPKPPEVWGNDINTDLDDGDVECIWVFVTSDFYGVGWCDLKQRLVTSDQ